MLIRILIALIILITAAAFTDFVTYKPILTSYKNNTPSFAGKKKTEHTTAFRLKQKADLLKTYINTHRYDNTYCFLIDMRIPSGQKRFFVYNLKKDLIETSGLVTHGSGSDKGEEGLQFSNIPGSLATSLGRYRIGNSYTGNFGLAYKLYGLDPSNSKAFERYVVLHAHHCVPDEEIVPMPICQSWGCPTVSPAFLTKLQSYINRSDLPLMLWIYY